MKLTTHTLLALTVILRITSSAPLALEPRTLDYDENKFDIGPVNECIVPTTAQLPECNQYVDYPVPAAFLDETSRGIKEKLVSGAVALAESNEQNMGGDVAACSEAVRRYECRHQFPLCTNESIQFINSESECTAAFTESCSSPESYKDFCGSNVTVSQSTCTSVNTIMTDTDYSYCKSLDGWSDWYITEWAAVLLEEIEKEIDSFNEFLPESYRSRCTPLYSQVRCGSVGQCWSNGERLELNTTYEVCTALFQCIPNNIRNTIEKKVNCDLYPSNDDKPTTDPTNITVTTPSVTTNSTEPTVTTPRPTSNELPSVTFPDRVASSAYIVTSLHRLLVSLVLVYIFMLYV